MFISRLLSDPIKRIYAYEFFKDFAFFSAVLVPFFTDWGHISLFQVQIIQSWFSFWVFLLEIPTGALADKVGRKHSLTIGSLVIAGAVLIYGSIPRFEIFLLAEFLFAVGYAFTSGADQALLYDTLKEQGREKESKNIMGKVDAIHLAGMMIAAPIGGLFAAKLGINAPMLLTAIPLACASLLAWYIPEPRLHSTGSESPKYREIVKNGLQTIRHNKTVRMLAIDSVLVSGCAYFVIWFYQPLLSQVGIPLAYFGLIHAVLLGSEIVVSSNFAWFEKLLGVGKEYMKNSALAVMAVFILAALYQHWVTVLLLIVIGAGIGYTRSIYIAAIANKYIESRERATVMSSIGMIRRLSLIVLNPVIGYTATRSMPLALFVVSLLPLLSLLIKEDVE